jgi:hypothetical protein
MDRQPRIEHRSHSKLPQDIGCSSDVITLRVRQNDGRELAQPQSPKLAGDPGLGRALIDEDGAFGHFEEDAVTLSDVQKRHA